MAKNKRGDRNLIGMRFGMLVVIEEAPIRKVGKNKRYYWKCRCDCGRDIVTREDGLLRKNNPTSSCGRHPNRTPHPKTFDERLYNIWYLMNYRCYAKNFVHYEDYGARGIGVCDEWSNKDTGFNTFVDWAKSNGYDPSLTIDRIDNNGSYSPDNCRWITMKEQNNNRRSNYIITYNGESHSMKTWSEKLNIPYKCLWARIVSRGWDVERAFTGPVNKHSTA